MGLDRAEKTSQNNQKKSPHEPSDKIGGVSHIDFGSLPDDYRQESPQCCTDYSEQNIYQQHGAVVAQENRGKHTKDDSNQHHQDDIGKWHAGSAPGVDVKLAAATIPLHSMQLYR